MNFKHIVALTALVLGFSACGVDGDKIFSANANDDYYSASDVGAAFTADVLGNDGGSGGFVEDVTNGYYGSCTIGTGALSVDYAPFPVNDGEYFADWFEYRIRSNNNAYSVGRVSVRFVESPSDQFEPDDFQEYARPISLTFGIPKVENHTSDYPNIIPLVGTFVQGQTIGGDEDWFLITTQTAPTGGLVTWLDIETIIPGSSSNSLLITVMDEWGFLMGSAGSGSGSGDGALYSQSNIPAGNYLVRISPDNGHSGEYTVRFFMYEAAPIMAPPAPVGIGQAK